MQAVDTNVLVRLLTGDDAEQAAIAESFAEWAGGGWVSLLVRVGFSDSLVLEVARKAGHGPIAARFGALHKSPHFRSRASV